MKLVHFHSPEEVREFARGDRENPWPGRALLAGGAIAAGVVGSKLIKRRIKPNAMPRPAASSAPATPVQVPGRAPTTDTGRQIKAGFEGLGAGIKEGGRKKVAEYAARVRAGENIDKVAAGLPPSMRKDLENALRAFGSAAKLIHFDSPEDLRAFASMEDMWNKGKKAAGTFANDPRVRDAAGRMGRAESVDDFVKGAKDLGGHAARADLNTGKVKSTERVAVEKKLRESGMDPAKIKAHLAKHGWKYGAAAGALGTVAIASRALRSKKEELSSAAKLIHFDSPEDLRAFQSLKSEERGYLGMGIDGDGDRWRFPSLHVDGLAEKLDLPMTGKAEIEYEIENLNTRIYGGEARHGATLRIKAIEPCGHGEEDDSEEDDKGEKTQLSRKGGVTVFSSFDEVRAFAAGDKARYYTDEKGKKWDNDTLGMRYAGRGAASSAAVEGIEGAFRNAYGPGAAKRALVAGVATGAVAGVGGGAAGYIAGKMTQAKRRRRALEQG